MKKHEIKVGGKYVARVNGTFTTVRVDAVREVPSYPNTYRNNLRGHTVYDVTNLKTGRQTTFRSAAKFRQEVKDGDSVSLFGRVTKIEVCPTCNRNKTADGHCHYCQKDADIAAAKKVQEDKQSLPFDGQNLTNLDADAMVNSSPSATSTSESSNSSTSKVESSLGLAAKLAAAAAPAVVADGLTDEQRDIVATAKRLQDALRGVGASSDLRQVNGQWVLVIKAGAGTGKTFTCKQLEQVLQGNGQYTAFNAKLVADAKGKFKRAACNTTHSLAFRAVGCRFKARLGGDRVRSWQVAQMLGITDYVVELPEDVAPYDDGKPQTRRLKAAFLAGQVTTAIRRFCQSDDAELSARHFRKFDGLDAPGKYDNSDRVKDYLMPFAQAAWTDLTDPNGKMPFTHDVYVKLWEMGRGNDRPVIAADYIMLDEYQDTAPVMVSILRQQKHALLVMVGDDNQRIYEWRGAINAADVFPGAPARLLSQSFRFGTVVADVANSVLAGLSEPTDLVMKGTPTIPSRVCDVPNPRCYLYRTNAGAVGKLLAGMSEGKRGFLIGGTDEIVSFCRAARDLQAGKGTTHPELGCFEKWTDVQEYSKEDEGEDLRLMVKLVDDFGVDAIIAALEDMPPEAKADFVCTTAHRSKGLEWSSVRLGGDFKTSDKLDDAERRLLYVAATRAQEELDLSVCPTFCGGLNKEGVNVPGLKITYTAPMPTAETLAAYRAAKSSTTPAPSPAAPTVAPTAPRAADAAVGTANGNPDRPADDRDAVNTWAKGRNGDWLMRGKPGQTGTATVVRKSGARATVTIKRVVWQNDEVALYEVKE